MVSFYHFLGLRREQPPEYAPVLSEETPSTENGSNDYIGPTKEKDNAQDPIQRQTRYTRSPYFCSVLCCLLVVILASFFLFHCTFGNPSPSYPEKLHCGSSVQEARSLGCVFDLLARAWVPEPCYEAETNDEYHDWLWQDEPAVALGPYPFFQDSEGNGRITNEDILSTLIGSQGPNGQPDGKEFGIYTTWQSHHAHCILMMKRQAKSLENPELRRVPISGRHMEHCVARLWEGLNMTMANEAYTQLRTGIAISFATC